MYPFNPPALTLPGTIELFPEYLEGLEGVEEFSHIMLLYVLDRASADVHLKVKPFLDDALHGSVCDALSGQA